MKNITKILSLIFGVCLITLTSCTSTPKAYEPTPKGKIIVKNIPEMKAFETSCEGNYFTNSNQLFRILFKYLNKNDLAMTIPVEAKISPAKMIFIVKDSETAKELQNTDLVKVITIPARKVLSIGVTGRYSQENFIEGKKILQQYLIEHPEYTQNGDFFAVYWDNPMIVPYFIRKSEINVPILENSMLDKNNSPTK